MSKSAFSQYLKHSQRPHKYHSYSCTVIQHIKEYHLQSSTVTEYDYLSPCMWTWNKDTEQDKIPSKQKHRDHVISLPSLTQDSRPLCALLAESSTEVIWASTSSWILLLGNSTVGEQLACVLTLPFIFIYLLCVGRSLSCLYKKIKKKNTMSFSISLPTEITAEPFQATASHKKQLPRLILVSQSSLKSSSICQEHQFDRQSNITFQWILHEILVQYNNFKSWEW